MKIIFLTFLLFLWAVEINAQTPVPADVIVIKNNWRFEVRNPALDESPFLDIEQRVQVEQDIRDTNAENRRIARTGGKPLKVRERPPVEKNDRPASAVYIYEIKVKNTGRKTIRALTLDYIFFESGTQQEVGRRQFASKRGIDPGETKNLVFRSAAPPTGAINAKKVGEKQSEQFTEQVIIQSVEHTDGSVWHITQKKQ